MEIEQRERSYTYKTEIKTPEIRRRKVRQPERVDDNIKHPDIQAETLFHINYHR